MALFVLVFFLLLLFSFSSSSIPHLLYSLMSAEALGTKLSPTFIKIIDKFCKASLEHLVAMTTNTAKELEIYLHCIV